MELSQQQRRFRAKKHVNREEVKVDDVIIIEEALQISINGKPFTITMRTPGNDSYLTRGLLFTEGILIDQGKVDIRAIEKDDEGITTSINALVSPQRIGDNYYSSRSMLSVSSCGICGKKELKDLILEGQKIEMDTKVDVEVFSEMFSTMKDNQVLFLSTGGCHAAACFDLAGNMLSIQEDIGRHNAVDKVIGELIENKQLDKAVFLLVSGRISFEIVSKTFKAKIPFLAAVSSPSSMSIEVAKHMGITLMGFCRGDSITCYSHSDRIIVNKKNLVTILK